MNGQQTHEYAPSRELHRELCTVAGDDDEVNHDMRPDEEIPGPAAAAEVPRVDVSAAVAPEVTARQRQDIEHEDAVDTAYQGQRPGQSTTGGSWSP